jgi:hypothetical protein
VAVGGDWPGQPDATTVMPQTMLVDWVRAYKFVDPAMETASAAAAAATSLVATSPTATVVIIIAAAVLSLLL